jgi:hypothetical protein
MTIKYPWDIGNEDGIKTRIVEDGDTFHLEYEGDSDPGTAYRDERRTDGSQGFGETRELREVAFVSNAEAMFLLQLTGIDLYQGGPEHTEAFLKLLKSGDFSRLKTIDKDVTTKVFK